MSYDQHCLLVGDAAGMIDPMTGKFYYHMFQCLLSLQKHTHVIYRDFFATHVIRIFFFLYFCAKHSWWVHEYPQSMF